MQKSIAGEKHMRRLIREYKKAEYLFERIPFLYLSFKDTVSPYTVPVFYGYKDGKIFFHSSLKGKKIELLKKSSTVSFAGVADFKIKRSHIPCSFGCRYKSITGTAKAKIIKNKKEKVKILDTIMKKYAKPPFNYGPQILDKTLVVELKIKNFSAKISE